MSAWPFEPLPLFGFDVVMADPPWKFELRSSAGEEKSAQAQYECMPTAEIAAMPVNQLASRDCWLWLWATFPMIHDGLAVLKAWGFCVGSNTRILTDDMRWVSAADLREGQGVLAFDESLVNGRRYYRQGRVVHNGLVMLDSYRLTMANGTEIIASAEHPWLMRSSIAGRESTLRWVRTQEIPRLLGDKRRKHPLSLPLLAPVCSFDDSYRSGLLAGAFDGEGSIRKTKGGLLFTQKRNALFASVADALRAKGYRFSEYKRLSNDVEMIGLCGGLRETMRFLMECRPPRLLDVWIKKHVVASLYNMESIAIESVEPVGKRECATLQTDIGTYIAEGFGSHNTYVTGGTWVKRGESGKLAMGPGYVFRGNAELVLIGRVGSPPICSRSIRNVIEAPRRLHSEKPDAAYEAAEKLFGPARRADLFSRRTRTGWMSWGNQVGLLDAGGAPIRRAPMPPPSARAADTRQAALFEVAA